MSLVGSVQNAARTSNFAEMNRVLYLVLPLQFLPALVAQCWHLPSHGPLCSLSSPCGQVLQHSLNPSFRQ